jgi:hypothetical protein
VGKNNNYFIPLILLYEIELGYVAIKKARQRRVPGF